MIDYSVSIQKIAELISLDNIEEAKLIAQALPQRLKKDKIINATY